jgi:hypothetical protein
LNINTNHDFLRTLHNNISLIIIKRNADICGVLAKKLTLHFLTKSEIMAADCHNGILEAILRNIPILFDAFLVLSYSLTPDIDVLTSEAPTVNGNVQDSRSFSLLLPNSKHL